MPMRTRIGPAASPSSAAAAAESAPGAVGKATKNASPCVSTSTPPWRPNASRNVRRCSVSAAAYPVAPRSCSNLVEPSMSLKRNVTVPLGRAAIGLPFWSLRGRRLDLSFELLDHGLHSHHVALELQL